LPDNHAEEEDWNENSFCNKPAKNIWSNFVLLTDVSFLIYHQKRDKD
jgi:hypothetical protein